MKRYCSPRNQCTKTICIIFLQIIDGCFIYLHEYTDMYNKKVDIKFSVQDGTIIRYAAERLESQII